MAKGIAMEEEVGKYIDRVFKHVPLDSKDTTIVILKGHLLTEEIMNELIKFLLPNPGYISKCRFNYSQTLNLARALSGKKEHNKWVWAALKSLNEIRNAYGHNLDPEKIETKEEEFMSYVEKYSKRGIRKGYTRMSSAVLHLIVGLLVISMVIKKNAEQNQAT